MKNVTELIALLRRDWAVPRDAVHNGEPCAFKLQCSFGEPRSLSQSQLVEADGKIPSELLDFWAIANSAELFKDVEYGQWGIQILSLRDAIKETSEHRKERNKDFHRTDLIIGKFLGDSELLLINCHEQSAGYGSIYVCLPRDSRRDWPCVARSLAEFLEKFSTAHGSKYWEDAPHDA